ncbi:hypothetical protein PMIT1313_01190 [Prochlorococcus marinus str. MIT 1313]|uniref:hypothetical protein n=1 Tax=Prochlorococcus TaxID=1218 RepID=UPI0007BBF2E6|nr:hypothetical protein [Prochlorococcus marinus]KZR69502.1 hypothetical protein PMIT1313_01190 [Prochlorococcus marinus str. MIT 1313]KZR72551.1 hypothetical protein PMIT1318_01065 [Prochlorococcus marinus str. MIT 1318]
MQSKPFTQKEDTPLWLQVFTISRWPFALVISIGVLSATALHLLSRPIPIRIVGGLQVDQIALPTVEINAEQPLSVKGDVAVKNGVTINSNKALPILGQVLVEEIKGSVSVDEIRTPVDVVNSSPLKVQGRVNIDGKVNVEGSVGASVKPKIF